jgi:curved DNA-binding protein CbpA
MRDPSELELSRGRLNDWPLAALLLAARKRASTGLLAIESGGGTSRLFLRDGAPCFAQVTVGYRPLGQVLVQYGLVDLDAFDRALPQLEKGRPLAEVLLEAKAIDEAGLAEGLRMQLVEHLRALAGLKDGAWEFKEQPLPAWAGPVSLSAERAVAVAMAAPAAEPMAVGALGDLGANLLKLKDGSEPLIASLELSPEERGALEALREGGSPEDLEARGLPPPKARWLAALALILGAAEPFDPRPEARAKAEEEARRRLEEARAQAETAARAQEEQARAEAEAQRRKAFELRARLEEEALAQNTEEERRRAAEQAAADAEAKARKALEQAVAERVRLREETEALVEEVRRKADEGAARIRERLEEEARSRARVELDRAAAELSSAEQALAEGQAALESERQARQRAEDDATQRQARLAAALDEAERIAAEARQEAEQERTRVAAECRARVEELERSTARGASEEERRCLEEAEGHRARSLQLRQELQRTEEALQRARAEARDLRRQGDELEGRARAAQERAEAARSEAEGLLESARRSAEEQARVEEEQAMARAQRAERERAEAEEIARRAAEEARLEAERLARELAERKEREEREAREREEAEARRIEQAARAAEAEARAQQQAQELAFARQAAANASQGLARKRALAAERLEAEARELLARQAGRPRRAEVVPQSEQDPAFAAPPRVEAVPSPWERAVPAAPEPVAAEALALEPPAAEPTRAERLAAELAALEPAVVELVTPEPDSAERGAAEHAADGQVVLEPAAVELVTPEPAEPEDVEPDAEAPMLASAEPIPLTVSVEPADSAEPVEPVEIEDADLIEAPALAPPEAAGEAAPLDGQDLELIEPVPEIDEIDAVVRERSRVCSEEEKSAERERLSEARERAEEQRLARRAQARELGASLGQATALPPAGVDPELRGEGPAPVFQAEEPAPESPEEQAAPPTIDLGVEDMVEPLPLDSSDSSPAPEALRSDLDLRGDATAAVAPSPGPLSDWGAQARRADHQEAAGGAAFDTLRFGAAAPFALASSEIVAPDRPPKGGGAVVETAFLEQAASLTESIGMPEGPAVDLFNAPAGAAEDSQRSDIASAIEALSSKDLAPPSSALDPDQFARPLENPVDLSDLAEPVLPGSETAENEVSSESSPWMSSPEADEAPQPIGRQETGGRGWNAALGELSAGPPPASAEGAELEPPVGEDEDLNEEDKLRRQRLLRRAFDNLGSMPFPTLPEGRGERAPAPAPAAPSEGELTAEDQALAARIEARAASIPKEDFFVRLGVPRSAGADQVKNAFVTAAMVFHPDRLPPALSHLSAKVREVFMALTEANEALSDDGRRAAYLQQLEGSAAAPKSRGEEVEVLEKQAEAALRKKEFTRAAELYGRAFAISKNAGHLAQEAWAIYLDPEQRSNLAGVKRMLEQALKMDSACDRASYSLGVIARVEGDLDKAEKLFRTAVHSNPKNAEASTELRLIEMRRKRPLGGKKGLFG